MDNKANVSAAGTTAVTTIHVDRSVKYQEIEGMGFFGARDPWWESEDPSHFYTEQWLNKIIDDLGLSMWRNEVYPNNPADGDISTEHQSGNWYKQKEMVQALKAKADEYNVPLKVLLTIWSPPGEWKINCSMKWAGDQNAVRGGAHPSTKNAGTLDPQRYIDYAEWLKAGLRMYRDAGVEVYGLSLQNEPAFPEPYNSCIYTTEWYCDLIKNVVPEIKKEFPDVKIFGSEHMLVNEASEKNYRYFFHTAIMNDGDALRNLDVFAVHGYANGIQAEAIANHKDYWTRAREKFSEPTGKPYWMTETSGYFETWRSENGKPGALSLAIAIHAALYYGKLAAWVWWQGSEILPEGASKEFCMMNDTVGGKRYYVSKHYFRFLRPGSRMVDLRVDDAEVLSCAFENDKLDNFVAILINTSDLAKTVSLEGQGIPQSFDCYLTTEADDDNCRLTGNISGKQVMLPPYSVITLVNGSFKE